MNGYEQTMRTLCRSARGGGSREAKGVLARQFIQKSLTSIRNSKKTSHMKYVLIAFSITFLSCNMHHSDNGHTTDNQKNSSQLGSDSLEVILRLYKFYREYISENISTPENHDHIQKLLGEYCTDSFREIIGSSELDADPFVDAQDYEEAWINNLSISKTGFESNKYKICFMLSFDNSQHCVTAIVKKEGGLWKIDNVSPSN